MKYPTKEELEINGELIDMNPELLSELYLYNGIEYLVLSDNSITTREEDNQSGAEHAIFPYKK